MNSIKGLDLLLSAVHVEPEPDGAALAGIARLLNSGVSGISDGVGEKGLSDPLAKLGRRAGGLSGGAELMA